MDWSRFVGTSRHRARALDTCREPCRDNHTDRGFEVLSAASSEPIADIYLFRKETGGNSGLFFIHWRGRPRFGWLVEKPHDGIAVLKKFAFVRNGGQGDTAI